MKKYILLLLLATGVSIQAQIISFQDANFKNALVTTNCVDLDNNGVPDADADINNDGEIEVSEAESIQGLYIIGQNISSLDGIENFPNLERLNCSYNFISSIDLSQNQELRYFNIIWNLLSEVDLSQNVNLEEVFIGDNDLLELSVLSQPNLRKLYCSNTLITELNTDLNPQLEVLQAQGCELNEVDLSRNLALRVVRLGANHLTQLDVTQNTNLERLLIGPSAISSIDLSQNLSLTYFGCHQSAFESLDLSANAQLEDLYVWGNSLLTTLDVSLNTNLTKVVCYKMNELRELNVQNGNNTNFLHFSAYASPNLECIQVDDPAYSIASQDWSKDVGAVYSVDCQYLGFDDVGDRIGLTVFPNPVATTLYLKSKYPLTGKVRLIDFRGKVIEEMEAIKTIDVSALSSGVYFLQLVENGIISIKKFIKK